MAQPLPTGDITTQPGTRIVEKYNITITRHTSRPGWSARLALRLGVRLINSGSRCIGWAIKNTNKRAEVDPPCGVLDSEEAVMSAFSCDTTIKYTNTLDLAAKQIHRE
ncbi:Major sperm protein isoform beta [Aphelenchoides avenae]|nr:Major sperm protein isoform beta [Aphelenchus avenae]